MRAAATLSLTACGRLRRTSPLRGRAALLFVARGRLRRPTRLRAVAVLKITAATFAPKGLGAKLRVIRERFTNAVLHQSLQVWVQTAPLGLRLALRVDDGPAVETPFAWENPHGGLPAVLTIADTELPQDGFTHYLTVSAWRETGGIASARAFHTFPVQLAAPPVPMPEWVGARLIRQNSSELPDLVEIIPITDSFYHLSAVRMKSKLVKEANWLGVKDWMISSNFLRNSSKLFRFNQRNLSFINCQTRSMGLTSWL
jgi:hypothetical protein